MLILAPHEPPLRPLRVSYWTLCGHFSLVCAKFVTHMCTVVSCDIFDVIWEAKKWHPDLPGGHFY